jgi:hypothetical protein
MMVILVPRDKIRDLFFDGLIMGTFLSWIFALITQKLGLLRWENLGPFGFNKGPVWLHLAWASVIIMFMYFKPQLEQPLALWAYILVFSWMSAMLDSVLNQMGLITYIHWSPWARFAVALPWFWLATWFNARVVQEHHVHT